MLSASPSHHQFPKIHAVINSPSPTPRRTRFLHPKAAAAATTSTTATRPSPSPSLHRMASCTSLYEILRIPVGATSQEIKSAYRRLVRTCHPDVAAVDRKDTSADEFMKLHAAYSTLSDPEKRAVYDRKLFRRRNPRPLTVGFSGYGGGGGRCRNWETDQCW